MDIPAEETVFLLLLSGSLHFADGTQLDPTKARGILLTDGEHIHITSDQGARFLLMAGKPLREPVAWGGPIVMNTREELRQAFREIDQGTFIKK
jgi:redox-sensitive bicupin YhaK (pirin superfamily)